MVKRLSSRSLTQLLLIGGTLFFSLAVLALLLYREWDRLFEIEWRLDPRFFAGVLLAYLIGLGLASCIWADLMRRFGSTLPALTHIEYFCLSQLAKRLPGTVWYIAGRTYLYKQVGESLRLVTFASSVELLITVLSGALATLLFAGYTLSEWTPLPWWGWLIFIFGALALLHPRLLQYWLRRFNISEPAALHYRHLLLWVCLYIFNWILGGFVLYCTGNLVTPIPLSQLPYLMGSWILVGTLGFVVFFLPSNLGFFEVGLSLLLATIVPSAVAVIIAIVNRVVLLIAEIVGIALAILFIRSAQRKQIIN